MWIIVSSGTEQDEVSDADSTDRSEALALEVSGTVNELLTNHTHSCLQ